jgi:hypothetical protein
MLFCISQVPEYEEQLTFGQKSIKMTKIIRFLPPVTNPLAHEAVVYPVINHFLF